MNLTQTQHDIYYDLLHHSEIPMYNVGGYINLPAIDVQRLIQAHEKLVSGFDAFGIRITEDDGVPIQFLTDNRESNLSVLDFSHRQAPDSAADEWLRNLFSSPLKAHDNQLFQAWLLKLSDKNYRYIGFAHHLIMDGWGFANWARTIGNLYLGENGQHQSLTWPEMVAKNEKYQNSSRSFNDARFWRQELVDLPDKLITHSQSGNGSQIRSQRYSVKVDTDLSTAIEGLAKVANTSEIQVWLGAWLLYLSRFYDREELIVGVHAHNRSNYREKSMVGVFTSVSPLRMIRDDNQSIVKFLQSLANKQQACFRHQRYPIGSMVRDCCPSGTIRDDIYQVAFNYLKLDSYIHLPEGSGELVYLSNEHEQTPLVLTVWDYGSENKVELQLDFNLGFFQEKDVVRMTQGYLELIGNMAGAENAKIDTLEILSEQDKVLLSSVAAGAHLSYPNTTLYELFNQQRQTNPKAIAIECDDSTLTYRELGTAIDHLAAEMLNNGVSHQDIVGIYLKRSKWTYISLLATLKCGAVFVALDPDYPRDRIQYIAKNAGVNIILCHSEYKADMFGCRFLIVDIEPKLGVLSVESGCSRSLPDDLAYIIYTSGSTGNPKGVMLSQKNLLAFLHWAHDEFNSEELSRVLASTSLNFDLSMFEIFLPLCFGYTSVMVDNALVLLEEDIQVTLINTVPSAINALIQAGGIPNTVKVVNLAGESLSRLIVNELLQLPNIEKVYNLYGPSEDTTYSTFARFQTAIKAEPSIGGFIANTQGLVVDKELRILPYGAIGELLLAGHGLAKGYKNREKLTAERFIQYRIDGQRYYRTGDLVRYLEDGNLQYLGRSDQQVKIRGFRVELGEIETVVKSVNGVANCVVDIVEVEDQASALVAIVLLHNDQQRFDDCLPSIKDCIQSRLPRYMHPTCFFEQDSIPLLPNGKINRSQLRSHIKILLQHQQNCTLPAHLKRLAQVWKRVIGNTHLTLTPESDFFSAGGNSISATRLLLALRNEYQKNLALQDIFEHSALDEMATMLSTVSDAVKDKTIPLGTLTAPLSEAQKRIWFIQKLQPETRQFNMVQTFRLEGELDIEALNGTFNYLLKLHKALVMQVVDDTNEPFLVSNLSRQFELDVVDLSAFDEADRQRQATELKINFGRFQFDLRTDLMLQAKLLILQKMPRTSYELMLNLHHFAGDAWTVAILLRDINQVYKSLSQKEEPKLSVSHSYLDFAQYESGLRQSGKYQEGMRYWQQLLKGAPECHSLPLDFLRGEHPQEITASSVECNVPSDRVKMWQRFTNANKTTLFNLLQVNLAVLINRVSGQQDIVLGSPFANRENVQFQDTAGLFLNNFVSRVSVGEGDNLIKLLQKQSTQHRQSMAYADTPFQLIVESLNPERNSLRAPIFQIFLNHDDTQWLALDFSGCKTENIGSAAIDNKYDITLYSKLQPDGQLRLTWVYDTQLFLPHTIEFLAQELLQQIHHLIFAPDTPVSETPWLASVAPVKTPIIEESIGFISLFEKIAAQDPQRFAVHDSNTSLTYGELNKRANQVSHFLKSKGVGPGKRVALALERHAGRIIHILAVYKLGACFIPLSNEFPGHRIQYMLAASDADLLVLENAWRMGCKGLGPDESLQAKELILVNDPLVEKQLSSYATDNPPLANVQDESESHIIFTSGSTGKPKGVIGNYGSLNNRINWMLQQWPFDGEVMAHITSMSFIRAIWELLVPLAGGASLVLIDRNLTKVASDFWRAVGQHKISCMVCSPSLQTMLIADEVPDNCRDILKYWFVSGEKLNLKTAYCAKAQFSECRIINLYGSTEVMSDVSWYEVGQSRQSESSAIGRPISGVNIAVTDTQMRPLPDGCIGELTVFGACVANGYLQSQQPTQFGTYEGQKFYRTGDLAMRDKQGVLHCLGRIDEQIKIRGYRVELGEVAATLSALNEVRMCVVLAKNIELNTHGLCAYVMAENEDVELSLLHSRLLEYCKQCLPTYMWPAQFHFVSNIPLKANGKVDKLSLAQMPNLLQAQPIVSRQLSETEEELLKMWATCLEKQDSEIGIELSFFDLGGHSLLIGRLIHQIQARFSVSVTYKQFFEGSSISELAKVIDGKNLMKNLSAKQTRTNKMTI